MKPVLLGQCPSSRLRDQWDRPLSGPTATSLCRLARLPLSGSWPEDYDTLCQRFTPMNAMERYESAVPWTKNTDQAARERWTRFLLDLDSDPVLSDESVVVVCLGRKAQRAVCQRSLPWYSWWRRGKIFHCTIPHPSGLNRVYNDPFERSRAWMALRAALNSPPVPAYQEP